MTGARAEPLSCASEGAERAIVEDVVDGMTLRLTDGRAIILAGIEVPRETVRAHEPGEGAAEARRHLETMIGKGAVVRVKAADPDRHGRVPAIVFGPAGEFIQERLAVAGFARIRPFPAIIGCVDRLMVRERQARRAGTGLWRSEFRPVLANDPSLIARKGLYVLVEGRVVSVGHGNRLDFLNFGWDWQSDFTVLVGLDISNQLAEHGIPTGGLSGRRVLVRGVIDDNGGPAIRLNDFREIEVLDDG